MRRDFKNLDFSLTTEIVMAVYLYNISTSSFISIAEAPRIHVKRFGLGSLLFSDR